jgi:hypothetical protein
MCRVGWQLSFSNEFHWQGLDVEAEDLNQLFGWFNTCLSPKVIFNNSSEYGWTDGFSALWNENASEEMMGRL